MAYTKEELVEFAAQAYALRHEAHALELEQAKLDEYAPGAEGDRHLILCSQIRSLRAKAAEIYAPVLAALEDDFKHDPPSK
jgi:hypothetical protein